ncbi:MAG TPA: GGDEF domain-containing protein [bacterium]|nr:GGDEF domain-containing protein [bacterium]
MAKRGALLPMAARPEDSSKIRRYIDPETNDRWIFSVPSRDGKAPAPVALPKPDLHPAAVMAPTHAVAHAPEEVPRPRIVQAVSIVQPQPGIARRFLDDSGEPLSTFFSTIAARKATDELSDSFEPIRQQILLRTTATDLRLHLWGDGPQLNAVPSRDGNAPPAHQLGGRVMQNVIGERAILHVPDLRVKGTGEEERHGALVSLPLASGTRVAGIMEVYRHIPGEFALDEINLFALAAQVTAGLLVRAEHLEKLIFVDKLTGLYNRAYFDDQIEREIERANRSGTSLALLMADLDHFKRINDNHGHQAGDKALAHLASIMKVNIRQIDVAARYGGEEFAILLPSITRARAVRTAERLRRVVADANFGEVIPELAGMKMSISLGLALYPDDAATSKQLIDRADRVALYAAKNRGRNRVVSWASAREGTESLKAAG